jgi:hypothetical protein
VPFLHFLTPDTQRGVKMRGRRAALYLQRGEDLGSGQWAFARICCPSEDCVNPDHTRSGNRKQFGAWLAKSGKLRGKGQAEASLDNWDKRGRTLTPEAVQEIRTSTESTYALARRFGVSQCAVWMARRGQTHKRVGLAGAKASSVFGWRGQIAVNDDEARAA